MASLQWSRERSSVGTPNAVCSIGVDRSTTTNVSSAHALLGSLQDAGYVARHPRLRTYTLGVSVVALGSSALECHPVIDLARDAARELARARGLEVAVTAIAGDDIVFLARSGHHSPRGISVHVGQHVPFTPPLGSVFIAWGDSDHWIALSPEPERLRLVLEAVRARGYSVALEADARRGLGHTLDDLAGRPGDEQIQDAVSRLIDDLGGREYHLRDLVESDTYDVSMIAVPIFGPEGDVVLALTFLGFEPRISGTEIAAHGEHLRDIGRVITKQTQGRLPASPGPSVRGLQPP